MRGSGGTPGGLTQFGIGLLLSALATYLFFDSVRVTTMGMGLLSGMMRHRGGGGLWETTSMGILFVPFFIGVIALFYDAKMNWAWWLTGLGLAVLAIEIFSRIRFVMSMKTTHLLGMIVLFAAGAGLMLRSYRPVGDQDQGDQPNRQPKSADAGSRDGS